MDADELLERSAKGERDFRSKDLRGIDLKCADLSRDVTCNVSTPSQTVPHSLS
jgi:hypothetical protein